MGSIAVDKGIAKLGSPGDFYDQLEPDKIAEHILAHLAARHPRPRRADDGARAPAAVARPAAAGARGASTSACSRSCPRSCTTVTDQIGDEHRPAARREADGDPPPRGQPRAGQPDLPGRSGARSCSFIINFGFFFGFLLGIPAAVHRRAVPHWWVLPILGTLVGYVTNWLAHLDDLRAGRAAADRAVQRPRACSCAASTRPPTSTRGSSPTTIVTLQQHRRGAAARAALGPHAPDDRDRACARRSTAPPAPPAGASAWRWARSEYDAIRESVAVEAVTTR